MENIKKYYDYLKQLIQTVQFTERRNTVLKYYENSLHDGYVVLSSKPKSRFIPVNYEEDQPMYYLLQIELYLSNYVEHDAAFITRLFPKINIIGSMLEELKNSKNFKQKNIKMLRKNNKSVENDLFEICTACLYLKNGFQDIEFIPEKNDSKTPDLRADNIYVECKRKIKECDYSIEERNHWYRQYTPISRFMFDNMLQLVFQVTFKKELSIYKDYFVLDIIKSMIKNYKCIRYDDEDINIKLYPVDIHEYNIQRNKKMIRMDKPMFNKVLFKYDIRNGGITTYFGLEYDKKMYKVSPKIDYACAGIWYSVSDQSIKNKAVSLYNNFRKAIEQIPDDESGNIHICYESYEGQEVEKKLLDKAIADLNKLEINNKKIQNIFLHILRPEIDDYEDSVFEETVF
ncbi:MAG: hypothetical protein A2355_05330, partial [Spirochaetes bacterium RIFOXYB1_FULL_32_8]